MDKYRRDRAQRRFQCADCESWVEVGDCFWFDNNRNGQRICESCLPASSKNSLNEKSFLKGSAGAEPRQPKWTPEMLPTLPWEVGDYDIHSWTDEVKAKYRELEQYTKQKMYADGFSLAYEDGVAKARLLKERQPRYVS